MVFGHLVSGVNWSRSAWFVLETTSKTNLSCFCHQINSQSHSITFQNDHSMTRFVAQVAFGGWTPVGFWWMTRDLIPEMAFASPSDLLSDVTRLTQAVMWEGGRLSVGPSSGSTSCPSWRWSPSWAWAAWCTPRPPRRSRPTWPCGWSWGSPPQWSPPQRLLLLGTPGWQSSHNT